MRTEANDAVASDSQDLTIERKIETAPADDLVKSDFTLSERISCDTKSAPVDEVYNSVLETIPVGDSVKPLILASPNKCSEELLAKEIRDDKTEAESLKRESMKLRDTV